MSQVLVPKQKGIIDEQGRGSEHIEVSDLILDSIALSEMVWSTGFCTYKSRWPGELKTSADY